MSELNSPEQRSTLRVRLLSDRPVGSEEPRINILKRIFRKVKPDQLMSKEPSEEKLAKTLELKPDMSAGVGHGNTPGTSLYDYFLDKIPSDLPIEHYKEGLNCIGFSRLILTELGGPEKARILWVQRIIDHDTQKGHAYVVPNGADKHSLAYNNESMDEDGHLLTVAEVLRDGVDSTDQFLTWDWKET